MLCPVSDIVFLAHAGVTQGTSLSTMSHQGRAALSEAGQLRARGKSSIIDRVINFNLPPPPPPSRPSEPWLFGMQLAERACQHMGQFTASASTNQSPFGCGMLCIVSQWWHAVLPKNRSAELLYRIVGISCRIGGVAAKPAAGEPIPVEYVQLFRVKYSRQKVAHRAYFCVEQALQQAVRGSFCALVSACLVSCRTSFA